MAFEILFKQLFFFNKKNSNKQKRKSTREILKRKINIQIIIYMDLFGNLNYRSIIENIGTKKIMPEEEGSYNI